MKTIESLGDLAGKRVLVRSDFNVPLDAEKNITDDGRIQAALPTLRLLLDAGAKVIIVAHLGRPKGKVNPDYSLAPVAERLREVTGVEVTLAPDTVGEGARAAVAALKPGNIVLLENVRFNAAEMDAGILKQRSNEKRAVLLVYAFQISRSAAIRV